MPLLERFGRLHVQVDRGEIVAILGAPGSGKSKLAFELAFLSKPSEGEVLFHGENPLSRRPAGTARRPREIALLVQNAEDQLFAPTVFDDVAFGPKHLGLSEEDIEARVTRALTLARLNAESVRDRSPFALSGGERRLAALAGVLAMEPEVLILDEPTLNLDARTREQFAEILKPLRGTSGIAWLTSRAGEATAADRAYLLNGGHAKILSPGADLLADWRELSAAGIELTPTFDLAARLEACGASLPSTASRQELEQAIVRSWRERTHDR